MGEVPFTMNFLHSPLSAHKQEPFFLIANEHQLSRVLPPSSRTTSWKQEKEQVKADRKPTVRSGHKEGMGSYWSLRDNLQVNHRSWNCWINFLCPTLLTGSRLSVWLCSFEIPDRSLLVCNASQGIEKSIEMAYHNQKVVESLSFFLKGWVVVVSSWLLWENLS